MGDIPGAGLKADWKVGLSVDFRPPDRPRARPHVVSTHRCRLGDFIKYQGIKQFSDLIYQPQVVSTSTCGVGVSSSFPLCQYWSNVITCKN